MALGIIALLTFSGAIPALAQAAGGPSTSAQQSWWSNQFAYRKSITITNPTATALSDYPVFLMVDFPFTHLSDATAELRLVDAAGTEVPSYVLDQVSSGGFVTSAWVLAFLSLAPSLSQTFDLYYGFPDATTPVYRLDSATAKAQAGNLLVDVSGTQPASASVQVTFAGTYTEKILSKVGYGGGAPQGYGAGEIASAPAAVVSPLSVIANTSSLAVALTSVYSAGALRFSQAYLLDNGTLVDARLLMNTGHAAVNGTALTALVDATGLGALGPLSTSYSPKSGLLLTEVSGAYFGYASSPNASSFEVGDLSQVASDAGDGHLSNASSGAGTAAAMSWNLGSLARDGSAQLISAWGAGASYAALASSLESYVDQPRVSVGQEDTYAGATSQVTSSWYVSMPITNASVSSGGLSIPLSLRGAAPVASRVTLAGTVSYVLPTGYASSSSVTGWTPLGAATGNATAYATTGFYSIQENSYTDSVRVTSGSGAGSGAAQLVSPVLSFPATVSKDLVLKYKASFSGSGELSGQWLYVAVDSAPSPTGPFSQALVTAAGGTSSSVNGSGCNSLSKGNIPSPLLNANTTLSGALVVDGSWRDLKVNLDAALGTASQYVRMRFCAATAPGYTGQVELDVASAGIEATGQAPSFLSASVSSSGSALMLALIPGAAYEPSSLTLNGVVSFPAVGSTPLKWDGGTAYNGTIPGLLSGGQTDPPGTPAAVTPTNATFVGASISPPPSSVAPQILVNGSTVNGEAVGSAVFVNSTEFGHGAPTFKAVDVTLAFPAHRLGITVEDANGNPLPGAGISLQLNGSAPVTEHSTDATGSASLELMQAQYNVTVDFQGTVVGSASAFLTSDQSITVPTTVYPVPLQVKNALGSAVGGADINVSSGSSSFALTSGHNGMATFPAVPGKEYNVTVSIAGSAYYAGSILASPNRATFEFGTSYMPPWIQIAIIGAVAVSMLAASLVVYLARRRPKV